MQKYQITQTSIEQFVTGGPEYVLHYIVVNDEVDIQQVPVIGWIHQRDNYADGTFSDEILPAVMNTEFHTVETAREVYDRSANCAVVGCYPKGAEAPDGDVEAAEVELYDRLQEQWRKAEDIQEPHRTAFRARISTQGKALKAMMDVA